MAKKNWQGDVRESAHKIWLAGLGALATAEQEGSKLFKTLVEQGERYEAEGKQKLKEAKKDAEAASGRAKKVAEETADRARRAAEGAWEQIGGAFDDKLAKALHRIGVPTRDEINALSRRIEELTRAVERARATPRSKPSGGGGTGSSGGAKKPAAGAASKPAAASKAGAASAVAPEISTTKDVVATTTDVVTTRP
jgi:poly(hydroxyalkanoate) granule-associated protein